MTPLTFRPGDRGGLISRLPGGKIVLIERGVRLPAGFGADARWLCEIREPTGGKVALARPIQLDSEWVRVRDARAAADAEREAAHAAALAKIDADARMHRALQEEAMALSPEALLALHPDLRAQFAEEDFRVVEFGLKGWLHCYSRITLEEAWARGWASHLQVQEEDGMPVVDFRGYRGVALVRTLSPPRDARALQIVRALPPEQLAEAKRIGGEDIGRLLAPAPGPGDVRIQLGPVGTALRDGPVAVAPIRVHVWDTDDDDRHSGIGEPGASAWRDIGGHPVEVNRWAEAGDPADLALRYAAIESLRLGALQAISPLLSPQGSTARVADTRLWESWNDAARLEFLELVRVATTAPASAEMTPGDRVACKEAMADPAVAAYFRLCGSELGQQVGLHTQTWVVNAGSTAGRYARAGVWKVRAPSLWDAEEVIRWVASQPPGFPVEPWDTYNSRDVLALRNVPVVTGDPAPSAAALGRLYASMPPEWREACDAAEAEMTAAIRSVLDGWAATVAGMAAEAVRLQAKAEAAEKARHGTPAPAPWYCFGVEAAEVLAAHPTLIAGVGVSRLTRGLEYSPKLVPGSSSLLAIVSSGGRGGKRHSYRVNWERSVGVHKLSYEGSRSEIRLVAAVDPGFILVAESYTDGELNWSRAWDASGEREAPAAPVPEKAAGFGTFADLLRR